MTDFFNIFYGVFIVNKKMGIVVTAVMMGLSANVFAGTVDLQSSITASTCMVSNTVIDGVSQDGFNGEVTFDEVTTADMFTKGTGTSMAFKPVSFTLSNCPAGQGSASVNFIYTADEHGLIPMEGMGKGLSLKLYANNNPVNDDTFKTTDIKNGSGVINGSIALTRNSDEPVAGSADAVITLALVQD
jgi:hypothetical protein